MIGAGTYVPSSLVTSAMACVRDLWLCIQDYSIHKSLRLRWSRPQQLASVNRGYVYRMYTYIVLSVSRRICFHTWLVKPDRYLDGAAIN